LDNLIVFLVATMAIVASLLVGLFTLWKDTSDERGSVPKPERFTDEQIETVVKAAKVSEDWDSYMTRAYMRRVLRDGPAGVRSYPDNIVELPDVSSDL
jgi:hypothetical protein